MPSKTKKLPKQVARARHSVALSYSVDGMDMNPGVVYLCYGDTMTFHVNKVDGTVAALTIVASQFSCSEGTVELDESFED